MTIKRYFCSALIFLTATLTLSAPYATADTTPAHKTAPKSASQATQQTPSSVAEATTNQLFSILKSSKELYTKKPAAFYNKVEKVLDPSVAFSAIARGVMGRYAHRVPNTSLSNFVTTFRKSLLVYYSKVLKNYDTGNLHIIKVDGPQKEQIAAYNKGSLISVPVNMTIGSGGQTYQLSYSMMKDHDTWKIRNIIIEGINLGLQFRNQFSEAVNKLGSPQQVIHDWDSIMQNKPIETPQAKKG